MRLVYGSVRESVRACMLALQLAGLRASKHTSEIPSVRLQLDERDVTGNQIELMGELSICRYLLQLCPWEAPDDLELEEWLLYRLKPLIEGAGKIKENEELLGALSYIESKYSSDYLGGDHPSSADVLCSSYIYPLFSNNAYLHKKYPKLSSMLRGIKDKYEQAQEELGESATTATKARAKVREFYKSEARITRNRGEPILPQPGKKNILITSALPYVNNVPHLGNIIGCVLSADVYARYCRLRGYNAIYICGTDEYGTATETKALQEGMTPKEICDKYNEIHKQIYDWFHIDFDSFGRTSTEKQTQIAQDIFLRLKEKGELIEEEVEQAYCESCSRFLADRYVRGTCPSCGYADARGDQCESCGKLLNPTELLNSECFICHSPPVRKTSKHIFINLPSIKDRLENWIQESSVKGNWSANCLQTTNAWIRDGLKPRCITRDLKWGTPVPLPEYSDKVFYVWFDAPIGYISITANYTDHWEKWWKDPGNVNLVQFMGKDNIPFHTVIFPSTLLGTTDNWTLIHNISTTEYLNYEAGKFSKSKGVGVFGDNAKETGIPAEVFRYYLLSQRPETSDTTFKWQDFALKNNAQLVPNVGNLVTRFLKFLEKIGGTVTTPGELAEADKEFLNGLYTLTLKYADKLERIKIKSALQVAMDVSSLSNKYIQDQELWALQKTNPGRASTVIFVTSNALRLVGLLLEPFMPSFSAKLYEQMGLTRTARDETLLEGILSAGSSEVLLSLVQAGQKIGSVAPIFRQSN